MPRVRLEQYSLLTSYLHSTAPLYSTPLDNYTLLHHHHAVHAVCELSFNAKKKTKYKNSSPKVNRNIVEAKLYTQKLYLLL